MGKKWGRVPTEEFAKLGLSQLHSVFLAFTYLVLRFNRSNAKLPHCAGAQLIMISHYTVKL